MSILKTMLYIVSVILCAMWLSFAVMGAWANYIMNQTTPAWEFFAINSSVLILFAYSLVQSIKGLRE